MDICSRGDNQDTTTKQPNNNVNINIKHNKRTRTPIKTGSIKTNKKQKQYNMYVLSSYKSCIVVN
jgi:hypothetical protein